MKRGVKAGHLHGRGIDWLDLLYETKLKRNVQRSKVNCILQLRADRWGKHLMLTQMRTSMNKAMADCCGLAMGMRAYGRGQLCKRVLLRLQ